MRSFVLAVMVVLLTGCAGSSERMGEVSAERYSPAPEPGKAMVVFMRPSGVGFAVQSTVYELADTGIKIIGIVSAKTKVAHQVEPGKRLFMVMGENADFMSAELQAGRTYYASVAPRMGLWKARFAFEPVRRDKLDSDGFKSDFNDTRWVAKTAATEEWFAANRDAVQSRRGDYFVDWMKAPEHERAILRADDGR